jgi:uncharacterized protein (DUF2141 family)
MKRCCVVVALILAVVACATRSATAPDDPAPEPAESCRLTVRLTSLESPHGPFAVALYGSAESFKQREGAVAAGRVEPQDGRASWTFEDLVPGVYAVAAFHDLNDNGQLDRSALGAPSEPYGFSNNVRGSFGPPGFKKAAFNVAPGDQSIEIALR